MTSPAWLAPIPHPLIVALALPLSLAWWWRAGPTARARTRSRSSRCSRSSAACSIRGTSATTTCRWSRAHRVGDREAPPAADRARRHRRDVADVQTFEVRTGSRRCSCTSPGRSRSARCSSASCSQARRAPLVPPSPELRSAADAQVRPAARGGLRALPARSHPAARSMTSSSATPARSPARSPTRRPTTPRSSTPTSSATRRTGRSTASRRSSAPSCAPRCWRCCTRT